MKNYLIKKIRTPILDKCYCDKCKEEFVECDLQEIEFHINDTNMNLVHAEFCSDCLHELIKEHCRYNYDLGKDYEEQENNL